MTPTQVIVICFAAVGFAIFLQTLAVDSLSNEVKRMRVNMSELSDQIAGVTAQVKKGTVEVVGKIDTLTEALANAGVTDPAVTAAVADLQAAAQSLDDVVPDAEETGEEV